VTVRAEPAPPAAVRAFDALAPEFDARFAGWRSVAAQRRAVRRAALRVVPQGGTVLELGGGTGEDALHFAATGRRVIFTDGSAAMVARAAAKAEAAGLRHRLETHVAVLEDFEAFAASLAARGVRCDAAFSNFAALNCLSDLGPVARGLARLLPAGAPALLVMFGPFAPGEMVVELLRGRPGTAFRRLRRGPVPARVGGHAFAVRYPPPGRVARAFAPWFGRPRLRGIGVLVPPSAAEPWISAHPRLLRLLEALDRACARPLALLGDHVLIHLTRTRAGSPAPAPP
jgi:SAM-dependent methyltransferase